MMQRSERKTGRLRQRPRLRQVALTYRAVVVALHVRFPGLLPQSSLCLGRSRNSASVGDWYRQ